MISNLPWEIQRNILSFNIKYDLHKELKKKIQTFFMVKSLNIRDNNFRKFIQDCIDLDDLERNPHDDIRTIEWYNWMIKKIYNGERPWKYISPRYYDLIIYLKKCHKIRFQCRKKYGFSIFSWINYLLSF